MKTYFLKYATIVCALFFTTLGCERQKTSSEVDDSSISSVVKEKGTDETDFYYTDKGETEFFNIRKDKVIIKTESAEDAKALCKHDVFLSAYDVAYIWVIATIDPSKTVLNDLLKMPGVFDATYGLEYTDGTMQYPTDLVSVNFKEGKLPEEVLNAIGLTENVESVEFIYPDFNGYNITLNVGLSDIMQICRDLYESGLCEAASPSFIREMKPHIE